MTASSPSAEPPPNEKPKGKGFRIGGKAKASEPPVPVSTGVQENLNAENGEVDTTIPSRPKVESEAPVETKTVRKGFKIGGKRKAPSKDVMVTTTIGSPHQSREAYVNVKGPSLESSTPVPSYMKKEATPVKDEREETAEEKAERKRRELKRKNEEAAKKQAQSKKKKRF
jgi:hypothetical protein